MAPHIWPVGAHAVGGTGLPPGGVVRRALFQVAPSAERSSCPSDDGHPSAWVLVELNDRLIQLLSELAVDGVECVGPVKGDSHHFAILLIKYSLCHENPSVYGFSRWGWLLSRSDLHIASGSLGETTCPAGQREIVRQIVDAQRQICHRKLLAAPSCRDGPDRS